MTTARRPAAWVEVSQDGATLILRICGELDTASRDYVEPAIVAAIPTAPAVILDLGDLTFCDSSGLAMFIAVNEKAEAEGGVLTFGNLQPRIARVFAMSGVDQMLRVTE